MACVGVRCCVNKFLTDRRVSYDLHQIARPRSITVINNSNQMKISCRATRAGRKSKALTKTSEPLMKREKKASNNNQVIANETLDQWMKESVTEIVKNIRQAPLFVNVYATENEKETRLVTEKAVREEDWDIVKGKWEKGEKQKPEGIILVEELKNHEIDEDDKEDYSKEFGIVIQGRGIERGGTACYLLKTDRAAAGSGLGLWCTHFCLVKVKSFRETAKSQFKNCWLLQSH